MRPPGSLQDADAHQVGAASKSNGDYSVITLGVRAVAPFQTTRDVDLQLSRYDSGFVRVYNDQGWNSDIQTVTINSQLLSMPSTQKSLVLDYPFGTYSVQEKPIPTPAADQILVKVKAAALNPADWRIQDPNHNIFAEAYPIVLGWDGAGVVEEVGSDVKGFAKGDRV